MKNIGHKILPLLSFSCLAILTACGAATGGGSSTSVSAAQVAAGKISMIASFSLSQFDQAQIDSNTNTCLNTTKEKDYVYAVKVSIPANPALPNQTVTITSLQMYSTLNSWETIPIVLTLKEGTSSDWIAVASYGNRCYSQVMLEASTNGGAGSAQVSTAMLH